MIKLQNISKSFGKNSIFSDLSFSVQSEEVCGLIGLNGIGKTTLLRIIAGALSVDSGSVSVLGGIPGLGGAFYRRIGVVLESDGFNGNLSFKENFNFFADMKRLNKKNVNESVEEFWSHLASKTVPVKQFSRGERMQCSLARAFLGEPELLLLDEPASNLDMDGYDLLCRLVLHANKRGATTIISSHRLDAVSELCGTVAFLSEKGLKKHSLNVDSEIDWIIRGRHLNSAPSVIKNAGGTVISESEDELCFMGVSKEDVALFVPVLIEHGVLIWEIFMKDRVESYLERVERV